MSRVLMPGYARGRLCHECGRAPYAFGMFCAACGASAPHRVPAPLTTREDDALFFPEALSPGDSIEISSTPQPMVRVRVADKIVATEPFYSPEAGAWLIDRLARLLPHAHGLSIDFRAVIRAAPRYGPPRAPSRRSWRHA